MYDQRWRCVCVCLKNPLMTEKPEKKTFLLNPKPKTMSKNFERVTFVIQLIDPMKEVVADRGGGWGSMLYSASRCCGDRSERWATKLLVGKIRSVVERQIAEICKEFNVQDFVEVSVVRERHDTIVCDLRVSNSKQVVKHASKEIESTLARVALKLLPHNMIVKKFIGMTYQEIYNFLSNEGIPSRISMTHFGKKERSALVKLREK